MGKILPEPTIPKPTFSAGREIDSEQLIIAKDQSQMPEGIKESVACVVNRLIPDGIYMAGTHTFNEMLYLIEQNRFHQVRDKADKSHTALENNTSIRQLVVYLLIKWHDIFFVYRRESKNGEQRLSGGFAFPGGHMNSITSADLHGDIQRDALRELTEELVLEHKSGLFYQDTGAPLQMKTVGVLQTSVPGKDNVNLVHTGIIVKVELTDDWSISLKKEEGKTLEQIKLGHYPVELLEQADTWLKIILPWMPQLMNIQ